MASQNQKGALNFIKENKGPAMVNFLKKIIRTNEKKLENLENDWKQNESKIIKQSQVIFCTLSTSGIEKLERLKHHIDYLIIDEACQSTEPSTLIPFNL